MVAKRESALGLRFLVDAAVSFSVAALEATLALLLVALAMGAQRTPSRQTVSSLSLSLSLGVEHFFFFFEFQISQQQQTTRDFYSQGSETLHFQVQGRGNGNFRGRKVPTFPRASRVLVALQSARKKEIFDQKKRGDGGGSSDWVGGHGRRQSGGSAFTPEVLPPGSNLRLLVAPRRASVRRF